jgi:uncharacterized membrane protein
MTADTTSRNTPDRMDLPVGREPFHQMLVPLAITCFAGALVTDRPTLTRTGSNGIATDRWDEMARPE